MIEALNIQNRKNFIPLKEKKKMDYKQPSEGILINNLQKKKQKKKHGLFSSQRLLEMTANEGEE